MEQTGIPFSQMVWAWERNHMYLSISSLASHSNKTMIHQQVLQSWGIILSIQQVLNCELSITLSVFDAKLLSPKTAADYNCISEEVA
jgi:hypothetical protein